VKIKTIILVAWIVCFMCSTVQAEMPAVNKLGRGLANIALGWCEIPVEMGDTFAEGNSTKAIFVAPIVGLFKAVVRTGVGIFEVVTFPFPVPKDYEPVLLPEYIMGD